MPRITVLLNDVACFNPEDVAGSDDEFYALSVVTDGQQGAGMLTAPIQVGTNPTEAFHAAGGAVFYKVVPHERILKIAQTAFDADAAKDRTQPGEMVERIPGAVVGGLGAIPNPYTAGAAAALPFAILIAVAILKLDHDDKLGTYPQDVPVRSLSRRQPTGVAVQGFRGRKVPGASRWSYTLRDTAGML